MKALVLYQPWASLMAIGVKVNETRSRPWSYLGDVAICAARQKLGADVPDSYMPALQTLWRHREQLSAFKGGKAKDIQDLYYSLPFGHVVCVVEKTGCISTNDGRGAKTIGSEELDCGNYDPDRYYYPTTNCRRIVPVRVRGFQGPFDLPPDVEAKVLEQLRAQA